MSEVPTEINIGRGWLKAHERIVIVVFVLAAGVWGWSRWVNYDAAKKDAALAAAQAQAKQSDTELANLASQSAQDAAQYQALLSALQSQNASLQASLTQMAGYLQRRQAVDTALPLPALAERWGQLVGAEPGDLTATTNGIVASTATSHSTVNALEQVPVLQDELKAQTQISQNNGDMLNSCQVLSKDLTAQVAACKADVTAHDKACEAQVSALKADAVKAKRNWFVRGLAAGGSAVAYMMWHYMK
jgi:multidrug efflux pump subunit AcrA (membrane-fusion protein)